MRSTLTSLAALAGVLVCVLPAPVSSADEVGDVISQATLAEYQSYMRVLTGVDPVPIEPPYYLTNRYSFGDDALVAAQWILDHFTAFGLDAAFQWFTDEYLNEYAPNVIGFKPGATRPEDIYVFSGHYDTYHAANQLLAPGCDDNASGAAAVMIAARILSQYQFEGSIAFITFSGEEQWLVGSEYYARMAWLGGSNIVAAINLDMILHPGFDNQEPDPDHDLDIQTNEPSLWLANYLAERYATYTPLDVEILVESTVGSDEASFWQYYYHAVGPSENTIWEIWGGSNDTYHQLTDTIDNPDWDWDFAVDTVRGAMATMIDLAGLLIPLRGDVNCDGAVNFGDINPFVLRLADPTEYEIIYPDCPDINADVDGNGTAGFEDINPFVALLAGL